MLIPNKVRQEHMPHMVYLLCKLVSEKPRSKQELEKLMTASGNNQYRDKSTERFNSIYSFAKDGGMIHEESGSGIVHTYFSQSELKSYRDFTYSLLGKMRSDEPNNKYNAMLSWYLKQDEKFEGLYSGTADRIREKMIDDPDAKRFGIEVDDIHGFCFWTEAFGIATFEGRRENHLLFTMEQLLLTYLIKHPEIKNKGLMPFQEFLEALTSDLYFIPYCYSKEKNSTTYSLSQAIRLLEQMEVVDLQAVKDARKTWHLTPKSNVFDAGNSFTHIKVR